jgi:transcription elongation factor S-II
MDSSVSQVLELKTRLQALTGEESLDPVSILEVLGELEAVTVTEECLRRTKIGHAVNALRKSDNTELVAKAKRVLQVWKSQIRTAGESKAKAANLKKPPLERLDCTDSVGMPISRSNSNTGPTKAKTPTAKISTPKMSTPKPKPTNYAFTCVAQTGDRTRDMVQKLLYKSLGGDDGVARENLAKEIEQAIFDLFGRNTNTEYKAKFRTLSANLADEKNPELNEMLFQGNMTPHALVRTSPLDLASASLRLERKESMDYAIEANKIRQPDIGETDQFKCGKCKARRAIYYQKQTRSADEPMTTFITCLNCGHEWRD